MKSTISIAEDLLALLRQKPATRVVRYVNDEELAICEAKDGDPLSRKSLNVVAWIIGKGSAMALLQEALYADTEGDPIAWAALPLRYGPCRSTWVLPENPYAPTHLGISDKD